MSRWLTGFAIWALAVVSYGDRPVIFWASDPVQPGETILAQGDLLDADTELQIARLDDGRVGDAPKIVPFAFNDVASTRLDSLQPSDQTAKYLIPTDWERGIYAMRPVRDGEYGAVRLLNAPAAWWIQGDQVDYATPGSTFSVFGKCLSYGDAKVYLRDAAGEFSRPSLVSQDMWRLSVDLGAAAAGAYDVFVHNGFGGSYGWGRAGTLDVKERKPWPQDIFNVVDYGAKPNFDPSRSRLDQTNDSPAFQQALDAAGANGGGVVFVPKGCYRLVGELFVPRFVTIRGESELATNLGWTDRDKAPLGFINGSNSFAVEDLTIFVQNYYSVIRGDHGHTKDAGNIAVRRVTVRANRGIGLTPRDHSDWKEKYIERQWDLSKREAALFFGGENIEIVDCDINASHNSLILDKASGVVSNNRLYCPMTYQASQYWIRGCHDLVMTDNDIYGGGCMGTHSTTRGVNRQDDWEAYLNAFSRNIYFAGNRQQDNWKWDREMMTLDSHGYNGPYLGPVGEAKGNTVTFPEAFPVLRVGGEIMNKSGVVFSKKKLPDEEFFTLVAKMVAREDPKDWDRCFANFYGSDEPIESREPEQFARNGDSRHYAHGKVNAARIRGSKGLEVRELRVAESWEELVEGRGTLLFADVTLDGKNVPRKDTGVIFDFDSDDVLYVLATVKASGPYTIGQAELLLEDGKRALDLGTGRLGGTKVDFNRVPESPNQHSHNINLFKGAFVYVLEGKGCGQYRKIVDGKDRKLVLDRAWDVEPDASSVISVHRSHDHQILVNNEFSDGGIALQMYGGAIESIIADNTATRAGGFVVTGLASCPSMYCQFLDNTVATGAGLGGPPFNLRGGRIAVEPYRPQGYLDGYQCIGIVMRGNRFENMTSATVSGPVQNVLVENNFFANTDTAVIVDSVGMGSFVKSWYWPQDVMIRGNELENVESLLKADSEAAVVEY